MDEIKDFVKCSYANVKVLLVKIFLPQPIGGEDQKHNYPDYSEQKSSPPIAGGLPLYLASMTDLLKQLQDSFCNELNSAWLKDIQNNEGENMNVTKFNDLVTLMVEAREQGYTFRLHYSSAEFIAEKIMGSSSENDLYAMPEWQKINPIIKMIEECDKQQWDHLKPHLELLKSQKVQPIVQQYTIEFSRKNGPFYPGKDNNIISVYGSFGTVGADLLLTTLVYGIKEKQPH